MTTFQLKSTEPVIMPINARQFQRVYLLATVSICLSIVLMCNSLVVVNILGLLLLVATFVWSVWSACRRAKDIGDPWQYGMFTLVPVFGIFYFHWLLMASSKR